MPFSGIRVPPKDGTDDRRYVALEEDETNSDEGAWVEELEREEWKKETMGLWLSDS